MNHITTINFEIPGHKEYKSFFNSKTSLDDSDIVIIKPFTEYKNISGSYQGKDSYGDTGSKTIREDSEYWSKEIYSFISTGKNVFIITNTVYDFFIQTGKHETSGTGRNAKTTQYVEGFNNYNFLRPSSTKLINANGNKFKIIDNSLTEFIKQFEHILSFACYIKSDNIIPILKTKNESEIVAGIQKFEKGNLIFLPLINFDKLTETKNDKEIWTNEAIKLGKVFLTFINQFNNKILTLTDKSIKPNWLFSDKYLLKSEIEQNIKITLNKNKIEKLLNENTTLGAKIEKESLIKNLLFETGKPLEQAVLYSLQILGYVAENYDNGKLELDAVILSPEGKRFIGECEGKDNKDIDITKFRQLNDSLAEDFEREEVQEKAFGLIFGNPQRLLDIQERTLNFTEKCKNAAKRENIGLIITADLFNVVKYLIENKDESFQKKCRDAIESQLGDIIKFPKINE